MENLVYLLDSNIILEGLYTVAKEYNLQLVSFDNDFDKTDLKRIER